VQLRPPSLPPTLLVRSRHSSVGTVTFGSRQWQETDRPFGTGVPGVKAAERVSGESSSFSAEVKHEWRSAFSSPYAIVERHLNTGTNLHFPSWVI